MELKDYKHVVQYYETDKMGITHHSNYIRWMEEARVDYLEQVGLPYAKLEEIGVISPVVNVDVSFKKPTTFSDVVSIKAKIAEYNGIKIIFEYEMKNQKDEVICVAKSLHCFINKDGRVVMIPSTFPELHNSFKQLL